VPDEVTAAGHLDAPPAEVILAGRATARGRAPRYEAGTCGDVACHGAGLASAATAAPRWQDAPTGACDSCHGTPPADGHPTSTDCASLVCHGGEIAQWPDGPRISEAGRARHIDGAIDSASAAVGQGDP
jgi:predicted CxxxxCH...CXXCH cytochrome family protein